MTAARRNLLLLPAVVLALGFAGVAAAADAPARQARTRRAETRQADDPATRSVDRDHAPRSEREENIEDRRIGGSGDDGVIDWWGWAQTLIALGVVIALIFAVRWAIRRFGVRPAGIARRSDMLAVLASRGLPGRHQLHVVRFGRRVVLIGATPSGLRRLAEVTDEHEAAEWLGSDAADGLTTQHTDETDDDDNLREERP